MVRQFAMRLATLKNDAVEAVVLIALLGVMGRAVLAMAGFMNVAVL